MARLNVSSGSTWEGIAGYSRAVRVGRHVFVSGTVATPLVPPDDGGAAPGAAVRSVVGEGDAYGQARHILVKIERYLGEAGASRRHVVRTRMYVTDADHSGRMWRGPTPSSLETLCQQRRSCRSPG
jgi:enamine deaminase RidA (YjgF/YER057c/UK114 family)